MAEDPRRRDMFFHASDSIFYLRIQKKARRSGEGRTFALGHAEQYAQHGGIKQLVVFAAAIDRFGPSIDVGKHVELGVLIHNHAVIRLGLDSVFNGLCVGFLGQQ